MTTPLEMYRAESVAGGWYEYWCDLDQWSDLDLQEDHTAEFAAFSGRKQEILLRWWLHRLIVEKRAALCSQRMITEFGLYLCDGYHSAQDRAGLTLMLDNYNARQLWSMLRTIMAMSSCDRPASC